MRSSTRIPHSASESHLRPGSRRVQGAPPSGALLSSINGRVAASTAGRAAADQPSNGAVAPGPLAPSAADARLGARLVRLARLVFRLVWLTAEIVRAALDFFINVGSRQGGSRLKARARCLQRGSQRVLRVLDVRVCALGGVPLQGLLVCNHLSYLDILILSALTPMVFVSKSEVKSWPIFGWFARWAGTLFVERTRRTDVARLVAEMEAVLQQGVVLVLFAEGTSSDGRSVLPFKSSLLEPAARLGWPIWAARVRYGLTDGDPAEEVCYWRDMVFGPHLLNLLTKRRVWALVRLVKFHGDRCDRKELAQRLHAEVCALQ